MVAVDRQSVRYVRAAIPLYKLCQTLIQTAMIALPRATCGYYNYTMPPYDSISLRLLAKIVLTCYASIITGRVATNQLNDCRAPNRTLNGMLKRAIVTVVFVEMCDRYRKILSNEIKVEA